MLQVCCQCITAKNWKRSKNKAIPEKYRIKHTCIHVPEKAFIYISDCFAPTETWAVFNAVFITGIIFLAQQLNMYMYVDEQALCMMTPVFHPEPKIKCTKRHITYTCRYIQ